MESRQIDGIDTFNFPTSLVGHPLLTWMGDDYVRFITIELLRNFKEQDAGTEMVAIKCEEFPQLLTTANERTGTIQRVVVDLDLQILLLASSGQHWRLRGIGKFSGSGLDQQDQAITSQSFDIISSEEAT